MRFPWLCLLISATVSIVAAQHTAPWVSDLKKFRKLEKCTVKSIEGWAGLLEDVCAPTDEVDLFNKRVRDPAGGVIH